MNSHVPRLSAPAGTRLILVRHGETLWNRAHRWQGHTDIALSDLGREQAATLPPRLAGEAIEVCYASDLIRAAETAELLCAPLGLSPVREAALREVCLGPFQGLTTAEIEARMPQAFARRVESEDPADLDFALGGMESRRQFVDRAAGAVQHCAERSPGQTVLIVAHGGVLRAFFVAVFGLPYTSVRQVEIPNCAFNSFLAERGRWRLETWADVSHLGPRVTRAS